MPIDRIPSAGIDSGGVAPSNLSTGAPYWDASGNVGIGTSSPQVQLQVNASGTNSLLKLSGSSSGSGLNDGLDVGINTLDAIFWNREAGSIQFATSNTERARIASDGPLRIAMQNYGSPPSSTNFGVSIANTSAGSRFYGQGTGTETQIEFGNTNGARGSIQTNATNTLYNTTSDYRLKEDVVPMTGALNIVSNLKPCTYTWKVNSSAGQGFIAHELQEVIPDAVTGEKDAVDDKGDPKYQMVDTSFLVATLTAAIQELKAEVDSLRAQVEAK